MPCSPERLASNRANALRSTGPRTPEGKERSRANGLKHGLTGEGLALPVEDQAEVDRQFEALGDDLRPVGERERILARRAAFLSVRLDRCARYEAAALSESIRTAEADFDDDRLRAVEDSAARLAAEPAASVRQLSRTPEGVDWLIAAWADLERDLVQAGFWDFTHVTRAEHLTGRKTDDPGYSRVNALAAAMSGDFRLIEPPDAPPTVDLALIQARKDAARADLIALVRAEVDRLRAFRAGLPFEAIARSRAEAPLRRLFDPSMAAVLFRRYETAAARELHKTFALFDAGSRVIRDEEATCGELGSSGNPPDDGASDAPEPGERPAHPADRPEPEAVEPEDPPVDVPPVAGEVIPSGEPGELVPRVSRDEGPVRPKKRSRDRRVHS